MGNCLARTRRLVEQIFAPGTETICETFSNMSYSSIDKVADADRIEDDSQPSCSGRTNDDSEHIECPMVEYETEEGSSLGSGHAGWVVRACHSGTGAKVAMKFFYKNACSRDEAIALRACRGPHVVELLRELPQLGALVLQLSETTLLDHIQRLEQDRQVCGNAVDLSGQILQALVAVHNAGWAHNDIKLENMLLNDGGTTLVLCDFDKAHPISQIDGSPHLGPRTKHVGTRAYAAPEVLNAEATYDGRAADLFSAGVCIYALVMQTFPWEEAHEQCDEYARARSTSLLPFQGHLAGPTSKLLQAMLRHTPSERSTAKQCVESEWLSGEGGCRDGLECAGKIDRRDREEWSSSPDDEWSALWDVEERISDIEDIEGGAKAVSWELGKRMGKSPSWGDNTAWESLTMDNLILNNPG